MSAWKNTKVGELACLLLAFACLAAAFYQLQTILPLVTDGLEARAEVVSFQRGVKGTRRAVYRFVTDVGVTVTAPDLFDLYLKRPHRGERLQVFYDPAHPQRVIADLGYWTWQGPVLFWLGFVGLAALGIVLRRRQGQDAAPPAPGR